MRKLILSLIFLLSVALNAQSITYRIVGVYDDTTLLTVCGEVKVKYNSLESGKVNIKLNKLCIKDKFEGPYDEYDMGEYHINMKLKDRNMAICIFENTMIIKMVDGTTFKYVVKMVEDKLSYCR